MEEHPKEFSRLLREENRVGWTPVYYVFEHRSVQVFESIDNFDQKLSYEDGGVWKHRGKTGSVLIKAVEVAAGSKDKEGIKLIELLVKDPIGLDINLPDLEG